MNTRLMEGSVPDTSANIPIPSNPETCIYSCGHEAGPGVRKLHSSSPPVRLEQLLLLLHRRTCVPNAINKLWERLGDQTVYTAWVTRGTRKDEEQGKDGQEYMKGSN